MNVLTYQAAQTKIEIIKTSQSKETVYFMSEGINGGVFCLKVWFSKYCQAWHVDATEIK